MVLLVLLRLIHFFVPTPEYSGPTGFLYGEWIGTSAPVGAWFWVTLLLIIQLYTIILICLQLKISTEATLIPGLAFVLCAVMIPEFGTFQPMIFANTFLLLALLQLFMISPRQPSSKQIYNAGLCIAVATFFYSSFMFFLIAGVSGINIIRSYRFNDIRVLILGFLTPFFLAGVYYFWFDLFSDYWSGIFKDLGLISFRYTSNWFHIGAVIFMMLLVLSMVINSVQVMNKKTNIKQNYFKILYWFLFSCFIMTLPQKNLGVEHLMVLAVPLSIIISEYLINWKEFRAQLTVNIVIVLIILYQFKDIVLGTS